MPRDRLALAVRVGREVDVIALAYGVAKLADGLVLAVDGLVLRDKAVLQVDAHLLLGQVAQMPHGRFHPVASAQIFGDRLRLCRRLDDDEFCHLISSNNAFNPAKIRRFYRGRSA